MGPPRTARWPTTSRCGRCDAEMSLTSLAYRRGGRRLKASKPPLAAREDGHALAVAGHAGDGQLGAADHEIDVDRRLVDAFALVVRHREGEAVAEREVARGVLVEQGVVE